MSKSLLPLTFTVYKGSADKKIIQDTTTRDKLDPSEVLIKITHSGVCGTDHTLMMNPMVLGHEGIGTIKEIGSSVEALHIGDRVGWGYQQYSCTNCNQCGSGNETYCDKRVLFGFGSYDVGSFGDYMFINEGWVFKIPDSITSSDAAPLMCAGPTIFTPLFHYVKSTDRVGVIGIGGLGHLVLQFARKMGTHVVAFSSSEKKREEAKALGANEVVVMREGVTPELEGGKINHLIVTTSKRPDFAQYYPILAPRATIYPFGVWLGEDIRISSPDTLMNGWRVQGSLIGNRFITRTMLDFAGRHDIRPMVDEFPLTLDGINQAMEGLEKGTLRFRAVLVAKDVK